MSWVADWLQSPGFGGGAAVLAAVIAYGAASRAALVQRENGQKDRAQRDRNERKAQWWHRAEWALDLTLNEDEEARIVGFRVLDALAGSEWAGEHEGDVIAAATERALSDAGSGVPSTERRGYRRLIPRRWW